MSQPNSCKRLQVFNTDLPPCCVQYYPNDTSIVFISSYKLEENGEKHGSIDIYQHDNGEGDLHLLTRKLTTAVLDLKIKDSLVSSCHSDGSVILWKFNSKEMGLSKIKQFGVFEDTVTSVNFNHKGDIIIATCTNGQTCSIDLEKGDINYFDTTHDLECWISAFGELGELCNVIFTGGDDSKLIAHDIRTNTKIWATGTRHHEAGVVSILPASKTWNSMNPNQLWTGSYDDNLRILDLRVMDKENPALIEGYIPVVHQKENLGGGVWRLIPSPAPNDNRILACCMYDGARIVDVKEDQFVVTKYFKADHESMCYGGDWGSSGITTCSFYDKVVQRWDPNS
ncbi:WD40 repeat-like protein [Yamadazyma tenuis]|uniref:WD40 repeat-like protein n=1 Tax=Candida tenuis (strain ATCC 10573 / BCRC 21748 / CBS 615 / JCM 9827 / NBRC 10315 / NRRL Y-1498 / VKM Y-70) TaxID=590646 RepID=G3B8M3_CANTC|nr:WD40 repeat-like protein [Yamadazyma tenuis ATCC 10573]EGV61767.1 WD40 repeat-like protein [Yamadazyma tenuis ATCC 10573]WEJ92998.1 WD40 repeat-like protein [Yamadazyma tenuis]